MIFKFTRLLYSFLIITIITAYTGQIDAQSVKRVLLEQHTGAWCGWCVDGSYIMDKLLEQYPDQVIGCKIHNGDSMVIAENAELEQGMSITFFPSGTIDRKQFGGAYCLNRGNWVTDCQQSMAESPKVDVNLVYSINETTRELNATLTATMLETLNEDLRFNCFITEDSVSGTGTGWDQHNYLSGDSTYIDNPYFNLPPIIVGYKHMKVVRKMLGGTWGEQGSFTNPAQAGQTFVQNFSYILDPNWKIKDIKLIGLVQVYSTSDKEILNVSMGYQGTPKLPKFTVTSDQPETKKVVAEGESFDKTFTLKNISDSTVTFLLTADKSTRTPDDWTVSLVLPSSVIGKINPKEVTGEITINPQQTADFTLKLTHGPTSGFGDATVTIGVKDDSDAIKGSQTISIMSADIQHFEVMDDGGNQKYSIQNAIIQSGRSNYVQISSSEFLDNIGIFGNIKSIIWNCGVDGNLTSEEMQALLDMLNSGKPFMLMGANIAKSTGGQNIKFFSGDSGLAVDYQRDCMIGEDGGEFVLNGTAKDPISDGMALTCKLIKYDTPVLIISNYLKAYPILQHLNPDNDTVVATRYSYKGKRAVYLAICPDIIQDEDARNYLIKKSLNWLEGTTGINDDISGKGIVNVSAVPNPINSRTNINYTLSGTRSKYIDMFLVDVDGRKAANLMSGKVSPGDYTIGYDAGRLVSGTYYIITLVDDSRILTPIVIAK